MSELSSWRAMTIEGVVRELPKLGLRECLSNEYWLRKPPPKDVFLYGVGASLRADDRTEVAEIERGQIRTYPEFPRVDLGMPPEWGAQRALTDPTWDFYRHCLRWTEPLLRTWIKDTETRHLDLWLAIVKDWCRVNLPAPGVSKFAWFDHAGANRLRLLCWAWELYRAHAPFDEATAQELLALIYIHARFMSDPATYPEHSNHGLEMTGALLSAATTVPEFDEAADWLALAMSRLLAYVRRNFCEQGFHLEQSPFYHFYVLDRLSRIASFLQKVDVHVADEVWDTLRKLERTGAYLCKPDGLLPTVGDTPSAKPSYLPVRFGAVAVENQPAPPCAVSYQAGYAVLRGFAGLRPGPNEHDSYVLFKCNTFWSPHFHYDALSFILFARGRDWIVDSGQLSYDESSPERKYVRSARAHSTLLIDGKPFEFRPVAILDRGHEPGRDWLEVEHHLENARHQRRIELQQHCLCIRDRVSFADSLKHDVVQLFHAAPDLQAHVFSPQELQLSDGRGAACSIIQGLDAGTWSVVRGQREPHLLGWYAPSYGKLLPTSTAIYTVTGAQSSLELLTTLSFDRAN